MRCLKSVGPGVGEGSLPLVIQTDTCLTSYPENSQPAHHLHQCFTLRKLSLPSTQIPPVAV